jgi:hypothetical protein
MVNIPPLHFGKIPRGRLDEKVVPFSGDFAALEKYVPEKLSLRQVTSKTASVFDLRGSLAPITGHMRLDIRRVVKATSGWDDPMPLELRHRWVGHFWKLEQLRGLGFHRPRMPEGALNTNARVFIKVDAANEVLMLGVWISFPLASVDSLASILLGDSCWLMRTQPYPRRNYNLSFLELTWGFLLSSTWAVGLCRR